VWYCDAHGAFDCRLCANPQTPPTAASALKALQEATGSNNVDNPWLGVCVSVALLKMDKEAAEARLREVEDHHARDRGRRSRTAKETREYINSDHPCCIPVGDACEVLVRLREVEAERDHFKLSWEAAERAVKRFDSDCKKAEAALRVAREALGGISWMAGSGPPAAAWVLPNIKRRADDALHDAALAAVPAEPQP
jgi:hypothetical protein